MTNAELIATTLNPKEGRDEVLGIVHLARGNTAMINRNVGKIKASGTKYRQLKESLGD